MAILRTYGSGEFEGRTVFRMWSELGSLYNVSRKLYSDGVSYNGKPIDIHRLSRSAWRYALDYPDEALAVLREKNTVSDEYWEQLMVRKAFMMYVTYHKSREGFNEWLKKNGYYEKYKDYRYRRTIIEKSRKTESN